CSQEKALADTHIDGIPRIPGFTADRPLPVPGRQQATEGTGNVQGGVFTKPEAGQIVVHHVDTHFDADLINIHIAGLRHGFYPVYPALPGSLPVPVASTAFLELEIARVPDVSFAGRYATVQGSHGHHGFDGRAGRILATQGPVE